MYQYDIGYWRILEIWFIRIGRYYVPFWYFTRTESKTLLSGKQFFPLQLKPFIITQWNCTSIGLCRTKKLTNGLAMQTTIARKKMGGASGYINGRFAAISQISSLQWQRPFFANAEICRWSASAAGLGPLAATNLQTLSSPAAIR